MKRPDLFVVGAFKSGTTALYEYLRAHPQVFMSVPKEPMYFGQDLTPRYRRMTEDEYLALFAGARPDQRAGEASPWYLYSLTAAREIRDFSPEAQIIVMLRNPVDVMHAQHGQLVFNRREDITDFADALAAEPARRRGEQISPDAIRPEALYYRHSVRFAEQVARYLGVFGRERVHFIVFDDFALDPSSAYRQVLEFMNVDALVELDFVVHNPSQQPRSRLLQRLVFAPPGPLRNCYGRLRRSALAHSVRDRLVALNSRRAARAPLDPDLRRRLTAELAPEVAELGRLIGRDLTAWSRP
ncbi:MAG TPA: sulfotransferase [Candidatus Limnocylindria bacterium]|nr:sulfotransferase [Candidatus Limnocylindria bacterium]